MTRTRALRALAVPALLVLLLAVACRSAPLIPDENRPWGDLDLADPVGWFTDSKLADLRDEPEACRAALRSVGVRFSPIEDRRTGEFCGFFDAVAVERSVTPYSGPVRVTCPLAAALFLWEREVVQPAAQETFGQAVARIEHVGTYSCRRVNGASRGRPSEHATANAIDVVGFRLQDGSVVRVVDSWNGDRRRAAFLREVRDGSCGIFRGVLGPDYNRLHADHFHLDMGSWQICS